MRRFLALPFAAVIVVFALSNRETVLLGFWPLVNGLAVPLFLALLGAGLGGLLLGLLIGRFRRRKARAP